MEDVLAGSQAAEARRQEQETRRVSHEQAAGSTMQWRDTAGSGQWCLISSLNFLSNFPFPLLPFSYGITNQEEVSFVPRLRRESKAKRKPFQTYT